MKKLILLLFAAMAGILFLASIPAQASEITIGGSGGSMNSTFDATCGGNCPSNRCQSCPCGNTPKPINIANWCAASNQWSQACCQCIVKAESGGNAHAVYENGPGSLDVGVAQVNTMNWASCSGGKPPCDVTVNRNCSLKVHAWGSNTWKFWATCGKCGCCGKR